MIPLAVLALALCTTAAIAQDYQVLPYGDLEYMASSQEGGQALPVWARSGQPCHATGWTVTHTNAAGGEVCVKGATAGEEFTLCGEGSGGKMIGSVKLRADAPGAQATIRLSWFNRLNRTGETKTVDLTADWQQFAYDLSPWRGRTIQLILNVWQDSSFRPTMVLVDEIAVGSPAAPSPTPTPTPQPRTYQLWIPKITR